MAWVDRITYMERLWELEGTQSRLFIDEVWLRESFEKASNSIRARGGWDIYLTEFELEMREEPEEGFWLTANWYQVRDDWRADAAVIGACYREHAGPPSKPLMSQIRDLQRAPGRAEVPGVLDELARPLAEEKEEGAEEGTCKAGEDRGDVDEETW